MTEQKPQSRPRSSPFMLPLACVALALVAAFALWVWPTPYRYAWFGVTPIERTSRFTGVMERPTAHGWGRVRGNAESFAWFSNSMAPPPTGAALWIARLKALYGHS